MPARNDRDTRLLWTVARPVIYALFGAVMALMGLVQSAQAHRMDSFGADLNRHEQLRGHPALVESISGLREDMAEFKADHREDMAEIKVLLAAIDSRMHAQEKK